MSPVARTPAPAPDRIAIRMYQVGFGDCFLLSVGYPKLLPDGRDERHVLIDFGSTRWPKSHAARYADIAADIGARVGGRLDAIVVTHRHKDHVAGFGDPAARAALTALAPAAVIQPWTEDPNLPANATGPLNADSRGFAAGLQHAKALAGDISAAIGEGVRGVRGDLAHLAMEQLPNRASIETLEALARAGSGRYLYAGQSSGLEALVPGLHATVLGPPTPAQWPDVVRQRADDKEYWIGQRAALAEMIATVGIPLSDRAAQPAATIPPGPARWLVDKMRTQEVHSLLRIVRNLDDAMNNTSVVLLLKIGDRRLLFPGDAQIENWSYALTGPKSKQLRRDLAQVDLYKVGHHGSRNASPRSLVALWQKRGQSVTTMMSTMGGVHGESKTAVPRTTLVTALKDLGDMVRTDELDPKDLYVDVSVPTRGAPVFTRRPGR